MVFSQRLEQQPETLVCSVRPVFGPEFPHLLRRPPAAPHFATCLAARTFPTHHASRLTPHASRFTPHASRFTFHVARRARPLDRCTAAVVFCHPSGSI
ncbi:MAG: hypothetical protein DPW09_04675 [Anaerolineae bacterium]|nr:hypothetical protein [Anaerolineae bacterium]